MTRDLQTILFATSNPHKLEEVRAILAPLHIEILSLDAFENTPVEPDETGSTFDENARLKAMYYARELNHVCLADDSGLEVDALDGAPGVLSARYAGVGAGVGITRTEHDRANNDKLLYDLGTICPTIDKCTARFVCAMCLADPEGRILHETRGIFEGIIARQPRGTNGFGYDPLLYLPDLQRTSAELSPDEKNARSHRGAAARALAAWLKSHLDHLP